MSGIVGPITRMRRESAEPQLQRMVESVRHDAFYVSGVWIDESLGVYVGRVEGQVHFLLTCRSATTLAEVVLSGENPPGVNLDDGLPGIPVN